MALIKTLQSEMNEWQRLQYPDSDLRSSALGIAEETGEVCRLVLKHTQNHRGIGSDNMDGFRKLLSDELGDVFVYMANLANKAGISLEEAIIQKWDKVQARTREQDDDTRRIEVK